MINSIINFFLENKLIAYLVLILLAMWGLIHSPFNWNVPFLPSNPISVDAIPDIGENQQIVYTQWPGRSPQDVEDQITYPLTSSLLGIPGIKSIRSNSMFGFSNIFVIFDDNVDFYWSRSRILEKLNALPPNLLPVDVKPSLGPDATALGQIFWYTIEGVDKNGTPTGGWDLDELRTIQDFYVKYSLVSAKGVSEVASIGGYIKEYHVDIDPDKLKARNLSLQQVMQAIKNSNLDIGAQTIEINQAEYFVRGLGYIKSLQDLEESVITTSQNIPVRIKDVARVQFGPAVRRGILDKSGAEVVGGVVVARFGSNPMEVIQNVKKQIASIEPGLPSKTMEDGTLSQLRIIPFYDRTQLIQETIGTLEDALILEILITVIVVILLLMNLKASLVVSGLLPIAVLMCFIAMNFFNIEANIVALSGIAIAIGTMVDMGIVLTENIYERVTKAPAGETLIISIHEGSREVGSAVVTAVATTIISFLPVFAMEAAEGKLFKPLAYTKTFALIAAVIVAICFIPPLMHSLLKKRFDKKMWSGIWLIVISVFALYIWFRFDHAFIWVIPVVVALSFIKYIIDHFDLFPPGISGTVLNISYAIIIGYILAFIWMPIGADKSTLVNFLFVFILIAGLLSLFRLVIHYYSNILWVLLKIKTIFLMVVVLLIYMGYRIFSNMPEEFMPSLNEGSFLLMPTSMPHSGVQENINNLRLLDMAVTAIPEVEMVVGKAGRVESALDPAPMSMYENVIIYKSEFKTDEDGRKKRFKVDKSGQFITDDSGELIPDNKGKYFRQWRDHIRSADDIWNEITQVIHIPGVTSAPKLQPIETRLIMLQSGMRAPMGIKVKGHDMNTIQQFGLELENLLREVEGVKAPAVFAERIVGKPYLLIDIDRETIARYGLSISEVQEQIQVAIGGMVMTTSVEGRERFNIRLRYPRELRSDTEDINRIFIQTKGYGQIPLGELVTIRYEQGPQSIKSEDGFLIGYVLFDKTPGFAEVSVVNSVENKIKEALADGSLTMPAGIHYSFGGNYEQQVRAKKNLSLLVPVSLILIFLILYFQFRSTLISLMVFSGVFVAFSGGFIMVWLYGQPWFMDFDFFGTSMRDFLQIHPVYLSVAVWVGFLALFGIATDDGVLVATYLKDSFQKNSPQSIEEIRETVVEGGLRRVRPAMMTTATTILALLPILSSTGRGADIMIPMAIPSFGGMVLQVVTMFTVPVLFSVWKESEYKWSKNLKKDEEGL